MEQRLAAILAADMAGYSRLMEADESGTLARLRTHRIELVDPAIAKNKGRIIKTTGDGMLVEFQSVTDAVKCAVEIQQRMKRRNSDVPQERRIEFRIGINLGDIIFDDEDIFGDGVNIASRIEQLADVGGICVTAAVATQIADRLEIAMEDLGEKTLKNISRPVRLYRVGFDSHVLPEVEAKRSISKPSIVVLPFNNMSGDPEQEFFADGLTEDIITELSRHHELFVISRNSSFVYKNRAVNVREVAEKLDVQYLVEGSVRKIGNRVRVTVQLIDTANDAHIWADKYDRKLDDIFAIQDEVTAAIAATLPGRVEAAQRDQLARAKPANMAAYECVLAAKVLHHRGTIEDNERAQTLIGRAVALDPDYAHAHAWRACILGQAWVHNWCKDRDAVWNDILAALDRALALDDNDADVHRILAAVNVNNNELTTARYHQERALALNPNYDLVVVQQGELLTWLGRPEEGIEWIRKAMQLNPHHPERFWSHLGKAHFAARQYGEAIEAFMHLSTMDSVQHAFAAACYGWLGDEIAAAAHLRKIKTLDPQFDLDSFIATLHYAQKSDVQHVREGLLKAGIANL
ncbi:MULTISPECIES: adenylate/guanylate cyclase domain-containing protein [unclassified Mesorhizobium]|uniref:adenylate/guanylate cyclase domain-containing protein n=1 Tax=unclassified Mesorhizobium TaxID=325217 RepID=UPI0003CFCBEF|nr:MULTISPECIES: adenylate/guanylate cyclase domain-containing protein [unclassified Mesorhizobium]ESZ20853.1 guanylyl cyclase [Mesorhizobium sp. L48C026A00]RWO54834.1 MAG: adenylate/guanylate cyclase domain-containing protein [Mesorhizobium sp.]RWO58822.1 MAG: adenylate/guanylate cyclase domain-containing protein [Mesorhizobium sp.]RWO82492.1 MAG: adenylate/guanylate cyclase domain-containing protein [Mesorhizobium sp.]TIN27706.1 MAG: adenylate/guanylate cyclase domain-containing protein [Mes